MERIIQVSQRAAEGAARGVSPRASQPRLPSATPRLLPPCHSLQGTLGAAHKSFCWKLNWFLSLQNYLSLDRELLPPCDGTES